MDKQTQAVAAAVMRSVKSVQNHWFPSKDNCEQIAKSVLEASGAEYLEDLVRALKACSTTGAGGKYYAEKALSKLPPELRGK